MNAMNADYIEQTSIFAVLQELHTKWKQNKSFAYKVMRSIISKQTATTYDHTDLQCVTYYVYFDKEIYPVVLEIIIDITGQYFVHAQLTHKGILAQLEKDQKIVKSASRGDNVLDLYTLCLSANDFNRNLSATRGLQQTFGSFSDMMCEYYENSPDLLILKQHIANLKSFNKMIHETW